MKLFLFFASLFIFHSNVNSQMGSWEIKINNKKVLESSKEDEKENCRKITASIWKKSGTLEVNFKEENPVFWKHSFLFNDENDIQLFQIEDTTNVSISFDKLRGLFQGKKKLVIYTTAAPRNPDIMVRMRIMHLCTIMLP